MLRGPLALVLAAACALPPSFAAGAAPDPEVQKGIALVESGEYDQAIFVLDAAVRRLVEAKADPGLLGDAYLQLGIAYLGKGHEAAARARFREAVTQIRTMTLSPDKFPPRVIDLFESAREEALRTPAATPAGPAAAAAAPPAPRVEEKKGGKGKLLLLGLGGAAAAGVAVAAGGGGGSNTPATPTDTRQTQTFSGIVNDSANYFQVVATRAGTMEATVTWEDGQRAVFIGCQWNDPPYNECTGGTNNRTSNTTSVLTVPVDQRTYLLSVYNYDGRGSIGYTLRVLHP